MGSFLNSILSLYVQHIVLNMVYYLSKIFLFLLIVRVTLKTS